MDIDQMGGSTLQAMADAVENATVVFICMSQKYKDSPNCRAGNINPIALRKAKIVYYFGLSECNRVKKLHKQNKF